MKKLISDRIVYRPLLIAYVVYTPLAVLVVLLCRHQLNLDGVAYIRIAQYYTQGNFDLAITGYWAPLISWLLMPWHLASLNPVLGGHIVNAVAGALFMAATWYLGRCLNLRGTMAACLPLAAGMLALTWQGLGIIADVLFAALLTLYFARSYVACRSLRLRDALLAGGLAGVAYLAKYYALPFFLLHHTLATLGSARRTGSWRPEQAQWKCWFLGLAGCAMVAAPWWAVLTARYGRPTYATTGTIVHSLAGPAGFDTWPAQAITNLRPGRITVWENPDEITTPWPSWSPFSGLDGMLHQLRLVLRNVREVAMLLFAADGLGLLYFALLALLVISCLSVNNAFEPEPKTWRWALLAVGSYLSGLMLIFAGSRRYYWPLEGLLLVMVVVLFTRLATILASGRNRISICSSPRFWESLLGLVMIGAMALPGLETARYALSRPGTDVRRLALDLKGLGIEGPLASNEWHECVVIGYYLDTSCAGVPKGDSPDEVRTQLAKAGVRSLLLFEDEPYPSRAVPLLESVEYLGAAVHRIRQGDYRVAVYRLHEHLKQD
ncbi:MAG: glycosyltransferase family 39 protein [Phycisphaerales bacterium]|nr:glycosyltransferase family 39 protein [Phycisphaerales bacterium]